MRYFSRRKIFLIAAVFTVLAIAVAAAAVIGISTWVNIPAVRSALCSSIEKASGLKADLKKLDINYINGFVIIGKQLTLTDSEKDASAVEIPEIRARLDFQALRKRRIEFRSVTVRDAVFSIPEKKGSEGDAGDETVVNGDTDRIVRLVKSLGLIKLKNAALLTPGERFRIGIARGELEASDGGAAVRCEGDLSDASGRPLGAFSVRGAYEEGGRFKGNMTFDQPENANILRAIFPDMKAFALKSRSMTEMTVEGSFDQVLFQGECTAEDVEFRGPDRLEKPIKDKRVKTTFQGKWTREELSIERFDVLPSGLFNVSGAMSKTDNGVVVELKCTHFRFDTLKPYVSRRLAGKDFHEFITDYVIGGEGVETTFSFRTGGEASKEKAPEFLMRMDFQNAAVIFDRGLEPLSGLSGTLFWDLHRVWFDGVEGVYLNNPLVAEGVEISELGLRSHLRGRFTTVLKPTETLDLYTKATGSNDIEPYIEDLQSGMCRMDLSIDKALLESTPLEYHALIDLKDVTGTLSFQSLPWTISSGRLDVSPRKFIVHESDGFIEGSSWRMNGSISGDEAGEMRYALSGNVGLDEKNLKRIASRCVKGAPEQMEAGGTGRISFRIGGPTSEPEIGVSADLDSAAFRFRDRIAKKASRPLRLKAEFKRTPDGIWNMTEGVIRTEKGRIFAEGEIGPGKEPKVIRFRSRAFPISELVSHVPLLEGTIRGGSVDLDGDVYWSGGLDWVVKVSPDRVAVPKSVIGSNIVVTKGALVFTPELALAAPAEIAFNGDRYVVTGNLHGFGENALSFRGRAQGSSLDLDALLTSDNGKTETTADMKTTATCLRKKIQALLNRFRDSSMMFDFQRIRFFGFDLEQTSGNLVASNDTLTMEQMHGAFQGGSIATEGFYGGDGSFWIAGGIDSVNAAQVFPKLGLPEQIIDGRMYLQGGISGQLGGCEGANYHGNIELEMDRGIIRKFPIVANILSLLNVSQLLTGRLPDLSADGMLYNKIRGSFVLGNGLLTTEDFRILSEAMGMTMVGSFDLPEKTCDLRVGVQPFVGIDKLVNTLPVIRHYLAGPDKSMLETSFIVNGKMSDPQVTAIPMQSLFEGIWGIFKRLIENPFADIPKDLKMPSVENNTPGGK